MDPVVPVARVADQPHASGTRRPQGDGGAPHPLVLDHSRSEAGPQLEVMSLTDEVEVELADGRPEAVRVIDLPGAIPVAEAKPVPGQVGDRDAGLEDPAVVDAFHVDDGADVGDGGGLRGGVIGADEGGVAGLMRAQEPVRIAVCALDEGVDLGDVGTAGGWTRRGAAHAATSRSRKRSGMPTQSGRWPSSYPTS